MQYLIGAGPRRQIDVQFAGDRQPMQRGALPLGHRHGHPRQGRGRDGPIDEQHRVDGAGVLRHSLHAGVGLAPRGRLARRRRVPFDARRHGSRHGKFFVGFRRDRDVIHVRRSPHDRRVAGRQVHFGADAIVIGVEAVFGHRAMPLEMRSAFAALMIQQVPDVIDLAAVPHRRAQRVMGPIEVGHQEAAGPPKIKRRLTNKKLPMHMCLPAQFMSRSWCRTCCSNQAARRA